MSHTPRPWILFKTTHDIDFSHEIKGIAAIYISTQSESNASLIASAPDLLAERDTLKAANAALVEALRIFTKAAYSNATEGAA